MLRTSTLKKTFLPLLALISMALFAGCRANAPQPGAVPASVSAQSTLPPVGPAAVLPAAEATPAITETALAIASAMDSPASPGAITQDTAARLISTSYLLPEPIETLLWPRPGQYLAISAMSVVYPVWAGSPEVADQIQFQMPANGGPLAFMPDGSRVAVLDQTGIVRVFAPGNDGVLTPVGKLEAKGDNASFSGDGKVLLLTDPDEKVATLYDIESGNVLKQLQGFASGDPMYTAYLSPDGKTVAWRSRGELQFQEVTSGEVSEKLATQKMIGEVRFSPDGQRLAVTEGDQLDIFRVPDGALIFQQGLSQPIRAMAFSPDGRLLAAAYGSSLQLWDSQTGLPLAPLTGHKAPLARVAFSGDGASLVSVDDAMELRIWQMPE